MPGLTTVIRALGPIDVKSVARDSMLRWLIGMPVVFALAFRWGIPSLDIWLGERYGFDLAPYYPLLTSFLVLMVPTLMARSSASCCLMNGTTTPSAQSRSRR